MRSGDSFSGKVSWTCVTPTPHGQSLPSNHPCGIWITTGGNGSPSQKTVSAPPRTHRPLRSTSGSRSRSPSSPKPPTRPWAQPTGHWRPSSQNPTEKPEFFHDRVLSRQCYYALRGFTTLPLARFKCYYRIFIQRVPSSLSPPFHLAFSSFVRSLVRLPLSPHPTHYPSLFPVPTTHPHVRSFPSLFSSYGVSTIRTPAARFCAFPFVFLHHVQCIAYLSPSFFNCVLPCFSFRSQNGLCIHIRVRRPPSYLYCGRQVYITASPPLCV